MVRRSSTYGAADRTKVVAIEEAIAPNHGDLIGFEPLQLHSATLAIGLEFCVELRRTGLLRAEHSQVANAPRDLVGTSWAQGCFVRNRLW